MHLVIPSCYIHLLYVTYLWGNRTKQNMRRSFFFFFLVVVVGSFKGKPRWQRTREVIFISCKTIPMAEEAKKGSIPTNSLYSSIPVFGNLSWQEFLPYFEHILHSLVLTSFCLNVWKVPQFSFLEMVLSNFFQAKDSKAVFSPTSTSGGLQRHPDNFSCPSLWESAWGPMDNSSTFSMRKLGH